MLYGDVVGVKVVLLVGVEAATPSNDSSYKNPAILAVIKQAMVAATRDLIAILAMSPRRLGAIGPRPPRSTPRPRKFVKPHKA